LDFLGAGLFLTGARTPKTGAASYPDIEAYSRAGVAPATAARGAGARGTTGFVSDATVVSHGKVIGRGTIDVRAMVEGVQSGKLSPRAIFENREGLLPRQSPSYYQEFVHPTPGVSGAGPQRIVSGQGGELYYTPDHYKTFIPLN
jgi:guanyl-specific ribonuclease Sa